MDRTITSAHTLLDKNKYNTEFPPPPKKQ